MKYIHVYINCILIGIPTRHAQEMRGSDFARRPLLKSQELYAALDAWILVKIWALLKRQRVR